MISFFFKLIKLGIKISIVLGGIAIVIAYARLSEFGDMRKELMAKIENSYAGRLSISGPAELDLSFPPRVIIHDVKIRNAKWGTKEHMMIADRVVAEIDLLPLIQGKMALPRLQMVGVDIIFEQNADGISNWDELNGFETAAGPGGATPPPTIFPNIAGSTVSISGGSLTVVSPSVAPSSTSVSFGGAEIEVASVGGGDGLGFGSLKPCP